MAISAPPPPASRLTQKPRPPDQVDPSICTTGYQIDSVFRLLNENRLDDPLVQEDISVGDRDFIDALFEEGTASYVDDGFYRRRAQIGTLVVSQGLPDYLLKHANRI